MPLRSFKKFWYTKNITSCTISSTKDTYPSHLYMLSPWSHSLFVNWSKHCSSELALPWISTVKSIMFSSWFETFSQFVHITWERNNQDKHINELTWEWTEVKQEAIGLKVNELLQISRKDIVGRAIENLHTMYVIHKTYLWLKVATKYMLDKGSLLWTRVHNFFTTKLIKACWLHSINGKPAC